MNKILKILLYKLVLFAVTISVFFNDRELVAQDIPELHMLVLQGDIYLSGQKSNALDGLMIHAKIGDDIVGSTRIGSNTSSRYSGFEIGPNVDLEGSTIKFYVGDQVAEEVTIFGPVTPSGLYCPGCTWSLPISRALNLSFSSVPLPTPTPAPDPANASFLTGSLIFGSVLSAPSEFNKIFAYSGDELIGQGNVNGSTFSITIDPGTVEYIGKNVTFKIGDYTSKTTYKFEQDDFITDFKLFFPEYIPPTPTATPIPLATAVPTATPVPEPTRTPTPVPEPTPTYTPTATPTPIIISSNTAQNDLIISESSDGGCNSRGGGPASVGLIILSLAPVYLLNRKRKFK